MQWFVFGQNIAKFQPKKIKSEPVQRRFHGKNGPNLPDFKETKKYPNHKIFMISSSE
jgi:hypothetical protein